MINFYKMAALFISVVIINNIKKEDSKKEYMVKPKKAPRLPRIR